MKVQISNIPTELVESPKWVAWRFEQKETGKKPTKVPMSVPSRGRRGSTTNPDEWGPLYKAMQRMESDKLDGVGYVFDGDGVVGVDLDNCFDEHGDLEQWAKELGSDFNSYTEITPSGKGLHIIVRAELPGYRGRRVGSVEVYATGRYFTFTGNHLDGTPSTVNDPGDAFMTWFKATFEKQEKIQPVLPSPGYEGADFELIAKAQRAGNGSKFNALWHGDLSGHGDDWSRADSGLCSHLAFWTGSNASRMDALFRESALMRTKWDEARNDSTYGADTIADAIRKCDRHYDPNMRDDEIASCLDRLNGKGEAEPKPKPKEKPKENVRTVVTNVIQDKDKDDQDRTRYLPPKDIAKMLIDGCLGWPKSVGGTLFALSHKHDPSRIAKQEDIIHLKSQDAFYAWCHTLVALSFTQKKTVSDGTRSVNPVNRSEFFQTVQSTAKKYDGIELLPHEPMRDSSYYIPTNLPASDGSALSELLMNLNADSEPDRRLMLAALLTPGWGGPAGARPAFVFTSAHGRGTGKTTTAELFARIWGGCMTVQEGEQSEIVRSRLLDESSMATRIVLIDNLKGRLSNANLEAMISARVIDGKRMYIGQASRPNYLTWYITANSPDLSRDLAERSILIRVGDQQHSIDFRAWAEKFIKEKRAHVLADLLDMLKKGAQSNIDSKHADRWRTWQTQVLACIPHANELAVYAKDSREEMDSDIAMAGDIERVVEDLIRSKGHMPGMDCLKIDPKAIHQAMVDDGMRQKNDRQRSTTAWIKHYLDVPPLKGRLSYRQARVDGRNTRVFVWHGDKNKLDISIDNLPTLGEMENDSCLDY